MEGKTQVTGLTSWGKAGNKILAFSLYKTFDYFYIYYVIDNNIDY